MSQTTRAILYSRVAGNDVSALQGQMRTLEQYARERDYVIVQHATEQGSTGQAHRIEIRRLLGLAKQGVYDTLIVCNLNRLIRDTSIVRALELLREFQRCGIRVVSLQEGDISWLL